MTTTTKKSEAALRETLRLGFEWLQLDDGQDPEAWITHHGIHGGKWELDGFEFSVALSRGSGGQAAGAPIIVTNSAMPSVEHTGRPDMPDAVWEKLKAILSSIGFEIADEWRQTGNAFSGRFGNVQFGKAWHQLQANYGTLFCADCPEKQKGPGYGDPHSTFCNCDFLHERAERVVYPEGWG